MSKSYRGYWQDPNRKRDILMRGSRKYPWHRVPVPKGHEEALRVMTELEQEGLFVHTTTEPSGARLYALTDAGRAKARELTGANK